METTQNEIDVTELKKADRIMTFAHTIALLIIEFLGMLFVFILTGYIGLIVLFVVVFIFFPSPYPTIPVKYTISDKSIMFNEKNIISIPSNFKIKTNTGRMFVSISHPRRGEIVRLYNKEPVKLSVILENMKKKKS